MRKVRKPHLENKRFWALPEEALRFIIKDAREAAEAMPENPKVGKYLDEINDACAVLFWRREHGANGGLMAA